MRPLITGYIDGELSPEQRATLEKHLAECEDCRREMEQMSRLTEELAGMEFHEPSDDDLERYWSCVYNRLERRLGWVLFTIGAIAVICCCGFGLIEKVTRDPNVGLLLKIGVIALVVGIVLLFVSVLRERLAVCRSDQYSKRVKR
jgi:predicted anti-sigma-YlaC factor YlaD